MPGRRAPLAASATVLAIVGAVLALCCCRSGRSTDFLAVPEESTPKTGALGRRQAGLVSSVTGLLSAGAPPAIAAGGDVVLLKNGLKFPKASFGLQIYGDDVAQQLTQTSLSLGYRNFFASVLAGNQKGFAKGFQASGVPREEVFICGSVVSNRAKGYKSAYKATKKGCQENLQEFAAGGITYLDMIMLDYPGPNCDSIKGQWQAFEEMLAAGQTKSLAVSNFSPDQLDCLLSNSSATPPMVNQLPFSISYAEPNILEENSKRGVVVQAWAPLGGSTGGISKPARRICEEIGKKYGKSWAQVALRWIVDKGATFSTQTRSTEHFKEDLDIFSFKLSPDDLAKLETVA
mmetsp:Transcript_118110/g.280423  ORF Transcript_118110/g.280423 Transcript_118110/m.280423 type:complete len:347 (+) Transcript_118110:39-1079(+)